MSVTSGFFNSLNHDRRYNAQQFSSLFDGIINDGIFANIGVAFAITVDSGVTINIGVGKAWFNSAWVYNDALLPKTLEGSEVVLDRIDAVVIEIDHNESVRLGDIKIVKGTPSSNPQRPAMANETNKHQHPLAYIYRKAGSTAITQADITNMVGTSECPYITGILQVQSIDNIVAQWEAQWNQWYAEQVSQADTGATELLAEMKSEFDIWFNDIQALLGDDVATALAAQVAELQGKFDTLAREGAVYDTIEDSELDSILGSDGTPIQGKTVMGGGGNVDASGFATKSELSGKVDKANVVNNFTTEGEGFIADARALKVLNDSKVSMELVWKNGSPSSAFAPDTISLDTVENEIFMIQAASGGNCVYVFGLPDGLSNQLQRLHGLSGSNMTAQVRAVTITHSEGKTLIAIAKGQRKQVNSTSESVEDNTVLVPRSIYRFKGVSV